MDLRNSIVTDILRIWVNVLLWLCNIYRKISASNFEFRTNLTKTHLESADIGFIPQQVEVDLKTCSSRLKKCLRVW